MATWYIHKYIGSYLRSPGFAVANAFLPVSFLCDWGICSLSSVLFKLLPSGPPLSCSTKVLKLICFCLFLRHWYHISSFSGEGDTEVSIHAFIPAMTFLALKVEMLVLESLWTSGGLVSGIKFLRDCSPYSVLVSTCIVRLDFNICWQFKLVSNFNAFYWVKMMKLTGI